jgi:cell wall-associated NlpC family hydrolase
MEKLGDEVELLPDWSNLKRGDLVFWNDDHAHHVAIMVDNSNAYHATTADPYHKALIQPLKDINEDQTGNWGCSITKVRRFPNYAA